MNLTSIQKRFEDAALIRGSVFLLPAPDALRFVQACEHYGVDILGVEGFKVFGEKIQPFQEHSLDLNGQVENNHAIVRDFIKQRIDLSLWFEIGTAA